MKKILIFCALLVGSASLSNAQGGGQQMTAELRARFSVDRIPATVALTEDQKTKVFAIFLAQVPAQDSLRVTQQALRASGGDMATLAPKREAMTKSTDAKIMALLSPAQQTAYAEYVKNRPAGYSRRGPGVGGQRPQGGSATPPPGN